jgi:hypothetical protein
MLNTWRLKLLGHGDVIEGSHLFSDFNALLEAARCIAAARPDFRLVISVPTNSPKGDRERSSDSRLHLIGYAV